MVHNSHSVEVLVFYLFRYILIFKQIFEIRKKKFQGPGGGVIHPWKWISRGRVMMSPAPTDRLQG